MTLTPVVLLVLLACGLSFSGLDFLRKLLTRSIRPAPLLSILALGQSPLFVLWWVVGEGATPPSSGYVPLALASVLLNIVANLAMLESVRIAPLSLTIPLLSLAPVFTSLLAMAILDQVLAPQQWAGVVFVVLGAFLLAPSRRPSDFAYEGRAGGADGRPQGRGSLHVGRGSLLMVVTAFLWSLALPLDRMAMDASGSGFHGLVLSAGVGVGTVFWLLVKGRGAELRSFGRQGSLLLTAIFCGALALALQLVAMTLALLSVVDTMKRAVGNVMAIVVGRIAFGEPVTWRKLAAVALMAFGVALVLT